MSDASPLPERSEEPPWKKIKLSLERPYKDDDGLPIPVLLDITADGQHVYEPYVLPAHVRPRANLLQERRSDLKGWRKLA